MARVLRPVGDRAVLVECGDQDPAAVAFAVQQAQLAGVVDVVPAASTVLVTVEHRRRLAAVVGPLADLAPGPAATAGDEVVLAVRYDGEDLAAVARAVGWTADEVVERHHSARYHVAFCGFSPGFAYLTGLDPALHLPRRAEPRTRVPAGSVAVAGPYSAVYPRATPGGWHLLGRCDAPLWDLAARPPTRLVPGTTVRFRPA